MGGMGGAERVGQQLGGGAETVLVMTCIQAYKHTCMHAYSNRCKQLTSHVKGEDMCAWGVINNIILTSR